MKTRAKQKTFRIQSTETGSIVADHDVTVTGTTDRDTCLTAWVAFHPRFGLSRPDVSPKVAARSLFAGRLVIKCEEI